MTKLRQLLPILFIAAALYACSGSGGIGGGGMGGQGAVGGDGSDLGAGSGQPSIDGAGMGDNDGCENCGPAEEPGDNFAAEPPDQPPEEPIPGATLGIAPDQGDDGDDGEEVLEFNVRIYDDDSDDDDVDALTELIESKFQ